MVRWMAKSKIVPSYLWGEAVSAATYFLNRSPTKRLVGVTPEEAWTRHKPDVTNMIIFFILMLSTCARSGERKIG